jgi:hypothetical protein
MGKLVVYIGNFLKEDFFARLVAFHHVRFEVVRVGER